MERIQSGTRIQRMLSMIPLCSVSRAIPWGLGGSLATLTDVKNWHTGKDPDAGKDWKQEKRTTEDEMVGWHHWLSKFEQTLGDSEGQESVACCSPWGPTKSWTQLSNWPTTQYCTVSTDTCRDARMWRRTPGRRTNLREWIGKCTFTSLKVCNLKARVSGTYCINFSF